LHIWKEHIEIDQITNFHEKINWQSLLYRIPLISDKIQIIRFYLSLVRSVALSTILTKKIICFGNW
jgi:hypothetical protein